MSSEPVEHESISDAPPLPPPPSPPPAFARVQRGAEVHLDEWVAPELVDERGFLRAGKILEWLDVVGALTASRHCRRPVVTAAVDGAVLGKPVRVGAHARLIASIAYTSAHSMGVRVNLSDGRPANRPAPLRAFMTFVAIDERGAPQPIPQFVPETATEIARFREGELRRDFRRGAFDPLATRGAPVGGTIASLAARRAQRLTRAWELAGELLRPRVQGPNRSYVHKIELVRAGKLNFLGTLYGGTLLRWVEASTSLSARAYLDGAAVRLVGLHGLSFLRPVRPNVFLHVHSVVVHASSAALSVHVRVASEDPHTGSAEQVLHGVMTYAPVDSRPVPRLLVSPEQAQELYEVERYLALQRAIEVQTEGL